MHLHQLKKKLNKFSCLCFDQDKNWDLNATQNVIIRKKHTLRHWYTKELQKKLSTNNVRVEMPRKATNIKLKQNAW